MSWTGLLAGLGRIKPIPAIVRAGYVYVAKRAWKHVSRNPVKIDLDNVGTMFLEPWDYVPSRLFFFGTWEPSMSRAMQRVGQDGMVALDIGANIGYYTLLLAGITGPKGRVFAFEPVPSIRAKLESNVAANGLSNVQIFPYGVSDQIEKRNFTFVESNSGASFLGDVSDNGIELRRISDLLDDETLSRIRIVKIDVEGMENKVLASILTILDKFPVDVAIFSEVRYNDEIKGLLDQFRSAGFEIYLLENDYRLMRYANGGALPPQPAPSLSEGQHDIILARGNVVSQLA